MIKTVVFVLLKEIRESDFVPTKCTYSYDGLI